MSTATDSSDPSPQGKQRRGWLFWGCLTVFVLGLALVAVVGYGVYQVYQFTSTEPIEIPVYDPQPGEATQVRDRVESFASEETPAAEPDGRSLTLTGDDLNALIAGSEEGRRYVGKVFVRVEGDRAFADVSLPLEELKPLGIEVLSGRYLNATIEIEAATTKEGKPTLRVARMVADGKEVPGSYVNHVQDRNLLEVLPLDRVRESMENIEGLSIHDGKIVVER